MIQYLIPYTCIQFLLSDGEAETVEYLFHEQFVNRKLLLSERFYFSPPAG